MPDFKYTDNTNQVMSEINREAQKKASTLGGIILSTIQKGMQRSHSGRTYKTKKGTHTASAPGEYPAVRSGELLNSLGMEVKDAPGGGATVSIGTDVPYADVLEGTEQSPGLRPFLNKAKLECEPQIQEVKRNWRIGK